MLVLKKKEVKVLHLQLTIFQDLFTLDSQTLSVTHDLMDCSCTGLGDTPERKKDSDSEEDSRDCQFEIKRKEPLHQITINQLLHWEHYKQPISVCLMKVKF